MLIRITAYPGVIGSVIDVTPAVARARIGGKTAVAFSAPETAALEPGDRAAGLRRTVPNVEAAPVPGRGAGGRFLKRH